MTHESNRTWQNDWQLFIREIAKCMDAGLNDQALTSRFENRSVVWSGKIRKKKLNGERLGIQFDMPAVNVQLADGRWAIVDYLFVRLRKDEIILWQGIELGSNVRFATQICHGTHPFHGIEWSDLGKGKGTIHFSAESARPTSE